MRYKHLSLSDDEVVEAGNDAADNLNEYNWKETDRSRESSSADPTSTHSNHHPRHDVLLNVKTGSALLVADCMGTGILALPGDMKILGSLFGLSFLVVNLFINFYAGSILCHSASVVEQQGHDVAQGNVDVKDKEVYEKETSVSRPSVSIKAKTHSQTPYVYQSTATATSWSTNHTTIHSSSSSTSRAEPIQQQQQYQDQNIHPHSSSTQNDTNTNDFISMTRALFHSSSSNATYIVTTVYYVNIFLVLGNYVLVMSHAVAAMLGENHICIPMAGIIASILMFGVSQLRTMARLGKSASVISLFALAILVVQCLYPIIHNHNSTHVESSSSSPSSSSLGIQERFLFLTSSTFTRWMATTTSNNSNNNLAHTINQFSILRKFAAASSIGFAVGSQKLLLNIRHEFKHRQDTPTSLGIALTCFGSVYILVCLFAGTDIPFFLFDVIPRGTWSRQVAGFLLWVHVSVSFAINSQALCSSLDRVWFHKTTIFSLHSRHATRWLLLSLLLSISSYIVANAIPFFGDLVSFIGALTSVPLTLLLPAIFHRRVLGYPIFFLQNAHNKSDIQSFGLVIFSVIFLVCGVIGSLDSIRKDWAKHGPPFSCQ